MQIGFRPGYQDSIFVGSISMLLKKILPVSVLALSSILFACGKSSSQGEDSLPPSSIELPLNTASDLIGSWQKCNPNPNDDKKSSSGTYIFNADGDLKFESKTFDSGDCSGNSVTAFVLNGSYIVGARNELDMTLVWASVPNTVYNIFMVQESKLTISNSFGPGASSSNRDTNIQEKPLILNKI